MKICKNCNGEYTPKKYGSDCCSVSCSNKFRKISSTDEGRYKELQDKYDSGLSWREVSKNLKFSYNTISSLISKSKLLSRTRSEAVRLDNLHNPRKHSEETKKKISEIRLKFLRENPDKVPYMINHSSKKSYPEELFENALKSSGIDNYVYNYRNGIYQYDFAFVDLKIDVEIDGGTHLTEKVIKIDQRRDSWSKEQGWQVLRFTATEVKTDIISCINKLKELMEGWRNRQA